MKKNNLIVVLIVLVFSMAYYRLAPPPEYRLEAMGAMVGIGMLLFIFLGNFSNIVAVTIKSLLFVIVGSLIIYGASYMPDMLPRVAATIVGVIIVLLSFWMPIDTYVAVRREKELNDTGITVDAKLDGIGRIKRKYTFYLLKASWRNPATQEVIYFESGLLANDPKDKITIGDTVKVLVNKNNLKHYRVDLTGLDGRRKTVLDDLADKVIK